MFQFPDNPYPGDNYTYGGIIYEFNGYGWDRQRQEEAGMPDTSPPSDGDKGDITVSGGGYIWVFDPDVVTAAGRALIDDADAAAQRVTLGLGNVNNTSDANKPVSTATQTALDLKYDKTGGTIGGAATVTGRLTAQADLNVTNGRIVNYGAEGSAERSYYFLNYAGSKSLYNDGLTLGLFGTPFKVHNTTQSTSTSTGCATFAGGVGVGLNLQVGGAVTVSGAMDVAGSFVGRTIQSVNGKMWTYGLDGDNNTGVIYFNNAGSKYIHQDGTFFNLLGARVAIPDTTDATTPTAAALQVAGGLGVAKQIRSGGEIRAGTHLRSAGLTFFGSSNTHYAGASDANIEVHAYAAGHYWSYNRSTGALVWTNGGGSGLIIYDSGVVEVKGVSTTGSITTSGAGSFGSLTVSGTSTLGTVNAGAISGTTGTFSAAVSCASLSSSGAIGGTRIDGTNIYSSGILQSAAALNLYNDGYFSFIQGGGYRYQHFAANWFWRYNQGSGDLVWIGDRGIGQQVFFDFRQDAAFIMSFDAAYKPGGGPWGDSASDERVKTIHGDYTSGLDEILQLQPVRYTFKGNETHEPPAAMQALPGKEQQPAPKSAPYPNSPHYGVAQEGTEFVGLIAQAVETVFPNMVAQREGFIDGQPVTDLRAINTGELIFALVNAVKTLAARVEALEAPV